MHFPYAGTSVVHTYNLPFFLNWQRNSKHAEGVMLALLFSTQTWFPKLLLMVATQPCPVFIKLFSMLNSVEHEFCHADKC